MSNATQKITTTVLLTCAILAGGCATQDHTKDTSSRSHVSVETLESTDDIRDVEDMEESFKNISELLEDGLDSDKEAPSALKSVLKTGSQSKGSKKWTLTGAIRGTNQSKDTDEDGEALVEENSSSNDMGNMRVEAMLDEAYRMGAQAGQRWRGKQIKAILEENAYTLNNVFNFRPLMIDGKMLPPVISKVKDAHERQADGSLHVIREGYRIEFPAKIVTAPPTWRSFLYLDYPKPQKPDDVLLPKTSSDKRMWSSKAKSGWAKGVEKADRDFEISLNLLTKTYAGMLRYKNLQQQHIVSQPRMASSGLQITQDGKALNIGDTIYRVMDEGGFNRADQWQVEVKEAQH